MESIECTNMCPISNCELNTKFNDKCYSDWSNSNLIAIVTVGGIYILKPQPDIRDGPFKVELIQNPNNRFQHQTTLQFWPTFDSMMHVTNHKQYTEIYSDPSLLTNMETLNTEYYPRRFRMAKWSPVVESYPKECLLATLTLDNQLLVFGRQASSWIVFGDLSKDYDVVWSQVYINAGGGETMDYEHIRRNLLSLSFCNICWKESSHGNGPILIAATIPGDLVIWQFNLKTYNSNNRDQMQFQTMLFDIKIVIHTGIEYISTMQLHEGLLIVSSRDGQVVLYDLTTSFNSFDSLRPAPNTTANMESNGTHISPKTLNLITMPPTAIIWHKDNIEISDLYVQRIPPDTFRLVLAKSTNICWSINNYVKRPDQTAATLSIGNSFSAIDGLDPNVCLHQSPATWLRPAGKQRAILIADDGSFFQVEFVADGQDETPSFNAIKTGGISLSHMIPRGLCCSPNGHMMTMVASVNFLYDPSKLSAPTKLLYLPTTSDRRYFVECIYKVLSDDWIQQEGITSPMDICDQIDYMRSIFHSLSYEQNYELQQMLSQAITGIGIPKNETLLVKLKIIGFIYMKLTDIGKSETVESVYQQIDLNDLVRDVILTWEIDKIIDATLSMNTTTNELKTQLLDRLTPEQFISMRNFYLWLSSRSPASFIADKLKFIESHKRFSANCDEICSICEAKIPFESAKFGTCLNQHRFDRCARTLLIIDSQDCDRFTCEHCQRSYRSKLLWPTKNLWLCQFCQ